MKPIFSTILALTLLVASPAGAAVKRPDATKMTCREATGLVASRGVVVLATGPSTYDIFADSPALCTIAGESNWAYVKTLDNAECRIGFRCEVAYSSGGTSIIGTSVGCNGLEAKVRKRDKFVISPEELLCRQSGN